VAIGDAAPKLEIVGTEVVAVNGMSMPALRVRNTGNAHGRISGFLAGKDASGRELEFTPSTFPVLPGETRLLTLAAQEGRDRLVEPVLPVTVKGTLEWADVQQPFEHRFIAPMHVAGPDIPPTPAVRPPPGQR